ncbi:unnamed protein product, partial [Iphiclides podalirius]
MSTNVIKKDYPIGVVGGDPESCARGSISTLRVCTEISISPTRRYISVSVASHLQPNWYRNFKFKFPFPRVPRGGDCFGPLIGPLVVPWYGLMQAFDVVSWAVSPTEYKISRAQFNTLIRLREQQ